MEATLFNAIKELGLLSVMVLGVFALCVWLVRFIAIRLAKEIESTTKALEKVCTLLDTHGTITMEAHRYQRTEHEKMITALERINGK